MGQARNDDSGAVLVVCAVQGSVPVTKGPEKRERKDVDQRSIREAMFHVVRWVLTAVMRPCSIVLLFRAGVTQAGYPQPLPGPVIHT